MNNLSEVSPRVRRLIQRRLGTRTVEDDAPLYSSGLLDSMTIVEMLIELENEFKISIPGAELQPDDVDSIAKISATVARFS